MTRSKTRSKGSRTPIVALACFAGAAGALVSSGASMAPVAFAAPRQHEPAAVATSSRAAAGPAGGECGKPGQQPCPMQGFMRASVAAVLATNDLELLAVRLQKVAQMAPDPAWTSWKTAAEQGAEAARKGDVAGARVACKGCHDVWRETYREKHRGRALPN